MLLDFLDRVNSHMSILIKTISTLLSGKLLTALCEILAIVKQLLTYLNKKKNQKKSEAKEKEDKEFKKQIEDVIDNGTLADLKSIKKN